LAEVPELKPRYNIAPTQTVFAVRVNEAGKREAALLHWGLIPSWADDPKIGYRMINARSETAASKPAFRHALRRKRCLIAASGFYEWQKTGTKQKQPYYIHRRDDKPFAFAGLWEAWSKGEEPIESCTILTTEANDLMRPLHDRMPVILDLKKYDRWLDPGVQEAKKLESLLVPYSEDDLVAYPISTWVNSPRNQGTQCIKPVVADIIELYGRKPRVKSPRQLTKELDAFKALGYTGQIFIVDDNFIANKAHVKRHLLPALIEWNRQNR
jgi:putative SOS response-associated peptidase YedK